MPHWPFRIVRRPPSGLAERQPRQRVAWGKRLEGQDRGSLGDGDLPVDDPLAHAGPDAVSVGQQAVDVDTPQETGDRAWESDAQTAPTP